MPDNTKKPLAQTRLKPPVAPPVNPNTAASSSGKSYSQKNHRQRFSKGIKIAIIATTLIALVFGFIALNGWLIGRNKASEIESSAPQLPVPDGFVLINGGTFTMGSPKDFWKTIAYADEHPQHQVTVSGFYMGKYEVTQKEYQEVMGTNSGNFKEDNLPVGNVSWYDAVEYCNKRSEKEGLSPVYTISGSGDNRSVIWNRNANGYRLPTEAEWEYACRAGTKSRFITGSSITTYFANYNGQDRDNIGAGGVNRGKRTAVGSFAPNPWGLYDMHGNVWEWCWDWYGVYTESAQTDPQGASSGYGRVVRGGSWYNADRRLRSASRGEISPSTQSSSLGFRLVLPLTDGNAPVTQSPEPQPAQAKSLTSPQPAPAAQPSQTQAATQPQPVPAPQPAPAAQPSQTKATTQPQPVSVPQSAPALSRTQPSASVQRPIPDSFVLIRGGTFTMGSPENEPERNADEGPQHQVTLGSFFMNKYEVTQKEYQEVMGTNPSIFKGDNLPVDSVSWFDAVEYCNKRSVMEGLLPVYAISGLGDNRSVIWNRNANGYRLPTEAEWEYACRAGTTTAYNTGADMSDDTGWYESNSGRRTHPVGQKPANAWGLYDMHGNVSELCWDRYGAYSGDAQTDSGGASSGSGRVRRGGTWYFSARFSRSAFREEIDPFKQQYLQGFRVVRS